MYSKYRNQKVYQNGKKVADSKKEEKRLNELRLLERAGEIKELQTQVKYELQPSYILNGKKIRPITYIADFIYFTGGELIIEDVKGYRTEVYRLKKKMFEFRYGIEIKEI